MKLQLTLDQVNTINSNIESIMRALDLLGLCIVDIGGLFYKEGDCFYMDIVEKPRKGRYV